MQIRIEIDVKPEELRRFLGLPDVGGLQEDVIQFLREKVGAASEGFDPASFVKENLQSLRKSAAWRNIVSASRVKAEVVEPEQASAIRRKPATKKSRGKRAAKTAAAKPQETVT